MLISEQESFDDAAVLLAIEHGPSAELLANRLERRGVNTDRVQNGNDVLDFMREKALDVIVAQTRLPGRTGIELVRQVPYLDPAVVLIGRDGNDDEIVRGLKLGAADYITRPFSPKVAAMRVLRFVKMPVSPSAPSTN